MSSSFPTFRKLFILREVNYELIIAYLKLMKSKVIHIDRTQETWKMSLRFKVYVKEDGTKPKL
jgi:hypothetical protein